MVLTNTLLWTLDPAAPHSLALDATVTTDGILLDWTTPTGAETLVIERKALGLDTDFTPLGLLSTAYAGLFTDTDVHPGVTYLYRAKVQVGPARSAFWSTAQVDVPV